MRPLVGIKLSILYAAGIKIRNIDVLRGMPLRTLHIDYTEVADLGPLAECKSAGRHRSSGKNDRARSGIAAPAFESSACDRTDADQTDMRQRKHPRSFGLNLTAKRRRGHRRKWRPAFLRHGATAISTTRALVRPSLRTQEDKALIQVAGEAASAWRSPCIKPRQVRDR